MTTNHEDQGCAAGDYVPQQPSPPPYVVSVPVKSSGVAVLLNFLWLGAGHLYAGNIAAGILLLILDLVLVLVSLIPFALILTVPIWIVSFIICSISVVQWVERYNRRLGEVGYPRL